MVRMGFSESLDYTRGVFWFWVFAAIAWKGRYNSALTRGMKHSKRQMEVLGCIEAIKNCILRMGGMGMGRKG